MGPLAGDDAPMEAGPRRRTSRRRRRRAESAAPADPDPPGAAPSTSGPAPLRRARRSVARDPALLAPAEIPDDAEGRVEFIINEPSVTLRPGNAGVPSALESSEPIDGPGGTVSGLVLAALLVMLVVIFFAGMAGFH